MGVFISIISLLLIAYWIKPKRFDRSLELNRIYNLGIASRILGTITYIVYAQYFSGGSVDAWVYDNYAAEFAEYFKRFDLSPFTDESLWRNNKLFYTNFVAYPAALFMIFTFNSTFGIYLLFSLVCFIGLFLFFKAFEKSYMFMNRERVLLFLMIFPALWFWTSTIGKDAFVFLGMGVLCIGISNKKINYLVVLCGLAIMYAFRPPSAYVAVLAFGSFFVLNLKDAPIVKFIKIGLGIVIIIFMANYLSDLWGIEEFSNDELTELQRGTLRNSNYGTGALDSKGGGIASIPQGILDVLARPFLWEIRNFLTLASSLEINFVLLLLFIKRKSVFRFIRYSLSNRLSTFSLAFVLIYTITVGIFENNIGLIARHRIIILPFLFLMAFAYDESVRKAYLRFLEKRKTMRMHESS